MFSSFKKDFAASIVVFFVALPLCLGIALASGAPLFSGLIAGIVGGIVVGALSGSQIGVSGPAAGLAAIVLVAITALGGFENFIAAVVIAGFFQIAMGVLKLGIIGLYFPSSVIKGMLSGIGLIIIIKQIPYFFGYVGSGDQQVSDLFSLSSFELGAGLTGILSMIILLTWPKIQAKVPAFIQWVQAPLLAVVFGVIYVVFMSDGPWSIQADSLVSVPVIGESGGFESLIVFPNFDAFLRLDVWITAATIALVASLETLLCVEATDRLDPDKRVTPTNRELLAQGAGNIISGMIGGLPVTQVIVRSSANIQSGGKTKLSAIMHGFFLVISVLTIPNLLNLIPLSVLAAILLVVGYKLAKPELFIKMYQLGWKQFLPFITTIVFILATDLLTGIGVGLLVGVVVILIKSYQNSHFLHLEENHQGGDTYKMTLAEEVTFINKGAIQKELNALKENSFLELDVQKTRYLDHDIIEILNNFVERAQNKSINIKLISERGVVDNPSDYSAIFYSKKHKN
ncbi:MAG: SulP family inorganic anion transporter [Flavobacteriaceae bacterium]